MIEKVQADWDDLRQMQQSSIEEALRWLATRRHSRPFGLLVHAIEDPESDSAAQLEPLTTSTASVPGGSPETRALAVWGLVIHLINKVGPTIDSRRRNALIAAFRLPRRAEITEPWKSSLGDRFRQLMALPGVFGDPPPTTTTPMHKAWKHALSEKLAPMLQDRLDTLPPEGIGWAQYVEIGRETETALGREHANRAMPHDVAGYRPPSDSAQPLFLDLFVTTVFMKRRSVYRRITERLVTARTDGVDSYMAKALAGLPNDPPNLPVRALWGARSEPLVRSRPGEPVLTRLRFPTPLQRGQKHYFSSEAIDDLTTEERLWVNVEVDHHGIAPGRLLHDRIPISGLTIRIKFDEGFLPEACWWYAEKTERERRVQPPDGDPHLLPIIGGGVEHTFMARCHPRDNYGVSILWPTPV